MIYIRTKVLFSIANTYDLSTISKNDEYVLVKIKAFSPVEVIADTYHIHIPYLVHYKTRFNKHTYDL